MIGGKPLPNYVYGDSCVSGDDKYVIAQFRHDAPMEWVAELRALLTKDELKYRDFYPRRHWVQSKKTLWSRVTSGIARAEITIVDPKKYEVANEKWLRDIGAEYGPDYDARMMYEMVGDDMLADSPLSVAEISEYDWMADNSQPFKGESFSSANIKRRVGGKQSDALVTAARAHAMITPSEKWELTQICSGIGFISPLRRRELIMKLGRIFDVEHAKSLPVLNEFSDRLAHAAGVHGRVPGAQAVSEASSHEVDHLQGADIAAGWAVDILLTTNGDYPSLARQFSWVSVNGVVIAGRE